TVCGHLDCLCIIVCVTPDGTSTADCLPVCDLFFPHRSCSVQPLHHSSGQHPANGASCNSYVDGTSVPSWRSLRGAQPQPAPIHASTADYSASFRLHRQTRHLQPLSTTYFLYFVLSHGSFATVTALT